MTAQSFHFQLAYYFVTEAYVLSYENCSENIREVHDLRVNACKACANGTGWYLKSRARGYWENTLFLKIRVALGYYAGAEA